MGNFSHLGMFFKTFPTGLNKLAWSLSVVRRCQLSMVGGLFSVEDKLQAQAGANRKEVKLNLAQFT